MTLIWPDIDIPPSNVSKVQPKKPEGAPKQPRRPKPLKAGLPQATNNNRMWDKKRD